MHNDDPSHEGLPRGSAKSPEHSLKYAAPEGKGTSRRDEVQKHFDALTKMVASIDGIR
jgi:hypothetical protein